MFIDLISVYPEPVGHRQTVVRQDVLHENLVLTDCRAIQIASRIGDLEHFQIALDGAVLAVCSMHDGNGDIDCAEIFCPEHLCFDRLDHCLVVFTDNVDLGAFGNCLIQFSSGEEMDVAHLLACEESSVL